ncbi:hypothetical protein RUM43_014939 [Polyplax serrata]|uniref:C2H2-type domain-containing protein n=1 Tax=Polyplax serrata TaxID=468196 RepID=A0AAN8Q1U6_POLSC
MDQVYLNIAIPLLVQDQNHTVIYLNKLSEDPGLAEDQSNPFKKDKEDLIIGDEEGSANVIADCQTFIVNNEEIDLETGKFNVSKEELTGCLSDSSNLKSDDKDSEIYPAGQIIELADGTTAFLETSKTGAKNEVYTPIRLYNGNVVYVGTLLSNNSEGTNGIEIEEKVEEVAPVVTEQKQEKSKGFRCSYQNCNKSYSSIHHLKVHLRVHTGDRPFRCSVEGCNKAFSTGFGLKTHFRTHNGERPYTCNHANCEKGFKTSGDLQKHIRTHTGERPFLCPIPNCGRSFTTCNICKVHVRTHTGERPYKCTYPNCDKTFASVTNQRNHMRIHSGEKPYVCSVEKCGRRFTEYSSLYKHNMVHRQQPHLCLICGKSYRQASGLMIHTKTAHGDKETYLMVDNPTEDLTQEDEQTAVLLVNNIKLDGGVLEDPLFNKFRDTSELDV